MNPKINELVGRIRELEEEVEAELDRRREAFQFRIEHHRIRFERDMQARHRRLKVGLLRYVFHARLPSLVSAPVIYSLIVPIALADLAVTAYQSFCFPLFRIPRVRRADYMHFDRGNLGYLNLLERLNCTYCAYANGVAAYFREVAGRTELYWCPIKHARRVLAAHEHYRRFAEFGDAEAYHREVTRQQEHVRPPKPPAGGAG